MANDCLVTKLKSVVQNDNLLKLGTIRLKVSEQTVTNPSAQQKFEIQTGANPVTIKVIGNGKFATSVANLETSPMTEETVPANTLAIRYASIGNYDIEVSDKYSIKILRNGDSSSGNNIVSFDFDQLGYCVELEELRCMRGASVGDASILATCAKLKYHNVSDAVGVVGDMSSYVSKLTDLISFVCRNTGIYGDIAVLANCPNLISIGAYNKKDIYGLLESLGPCTALVDVGMDGTLVTGSIDAFVAAQIANGRATCDKLFLQWAMYMFTFGGVNYHDPTYAYLTWESASKIIVYCGYYGADFKTNCTKIYAKGATAEEIAAWQAAGKTVVVVS